MARSAPRAKTGCKTCRIRRVKCDETRPSCLKCVGTKRECDWFAQDQAVTKPPANQTSIASQTASLPFTSYAVPFRIPGSQQERRLLHYFHVQAAADIGGFLPTAFWSQTVLQASHHDAIVRQALLALSSLHLDLATRAAESELGGLGSEPVRPTTLGRYGNVLRALQRRIDETAVSWKTGSSEKDNETARKALICCVLFYCFECGLGDSRAAVRHLDGGLRLFATVTEASDPRCGLQQDAPDTQVAEILGRLDMQASFFDDARIPRLALVSAKERAVGADELGEAFAFSSLQEARRELTRLQNWMFRLLLENGPFSGDPGDLPDTHVSWEKDRLRSEFARWEERLDPLLVREHGDGSDDKMRLCGMQTLVIQHRTSRMLLESRLPENRGVFGAVPNPHAEEILRLAESTLRQLGTQGRRVFSSETGIVAPLALLAVKCADESVCRRAFRLLLESRRMEGLYNSTTMTAIIEGLEMVRQRRKVEEPRSRTGTEDKDPISLEHSALDVIDQASGGMDSIGDVLKGFLGSAEDDLE